MMAHARVVVGVILRYLLRWRGGGQGLNFEVYPRGTDYRGTKVPETEENDRVDPQWTTRDPDVCIRDSSLDGGLRVFRRVEPPSG